MFVSKNNVYIITAYNMTVCYLNFKFHFLVSYFQQNPLKYGKQLVDRTVHSTVKLKNHD